MPKHVECNPPVGITERPLLLSCGHDKGDPATGNVGENVLEVGWFHAHEAPPLTFGPLATV
jgi:hypothetical protein